MTRPVLYSFRRCPYAMRARLGIAASRIQVELREVLLRDKPAQMLEASPKGTVPVLVLPDGKVIEESLDIMMWALGENDPQGWLSPDQASLEEVLDLIVESDGPFKAALDHYKYPARYEDCDPLEARKLGSGFIAMLDGRLERHAFLGGNQFSLGDAAILPFVRQFAHVDRDWFWSRDWKRVTRLLDAFLASDRLAAIMEKYPQWRGGEGITFPREFQR